MHPGRLNQPDRYSRKRVRHVFVDSMSDLFHAQVPYAFVDRVFETIGRKRDLQFQVLTKRPDRMVRWYQSHPDWANFAAAFPNVWLGVSVETQDYLWRAEELAKIPAAVRFVSCEPLLGPVDLRHLNCWLGTNGLPSAFSCSVAKKWCQ